MGAKKDNSRDVTGTEGSQGILIDVVGSHESSRRIYLGKPHETSIGGESRDIPRDAKWEHQATHVIPWDLAGTPEHAGSYLAFSGIPRDPTRPHGKSRGMPWGAAVGSRGTP